MVTSLLSFIVEQPTLNVIRGLLMRNRPWHLRELANHYGLSVAGVSDILRRLSEAGLLYEERLNNRRYVSLAISKSEKDSLTELFLNYEAVKVQQRSARLGKNAVAKLTAMDEMYSFYRKVKNK